MPDMVVTHFPSITFIQFVCNFGGLLGMWLGLSVAVIFDHVIKLARFSFRKYVFHTTNNTQNTFVNTFKLVNRNPTSNFEAAGTSKWKNVRPRLKTNIVKESIITHPGMWY